MKKLLIAVFLMIAVLQGHAQYDSNRVDLPVSGYGFSWNHGTFRSPLKLYSDTPRLAIKDSGSVAMKNSVLYLWGNGKWCGVSGKYSAKPITGIVGNGGGDDPVSNTSTYVNTKLIGLNSNISITYAGIQLFNYGSYSSFTFNSSTGTISISPNKWTAGASLFINLNQ